MLLYHGDTKEASIMSAPRASTDEGESILPGAANRSIEQRR